MANMKIRIVKGEVSASALRAYYYGTSVETRQQDEDQGINTISPGDVYTFEFKYNDIGKGEYKLGYSGKEMLAIKEFLASVVDPSTYRIEDRGIFGARRTRVASSDAEAATDRNSPISMRDGFTFDEKTQAALTIWQMNNNVSIREYGITHLGWTRDEDSHFSEEIGSFGLASFAIAHGWSQDRKHFYDEGFGSPPSKVDAATEQIREAISPNPPSSPSRLHMAATRVADVIHEAVPKDNEGRAIETGEMTKEQHQQHALSELSTPEPNGNQAPWEDPSGKRIGVFVDTDFTLENPPSFSYEEDMISYLLMKEREALEKVFDHYGKASTWPFPIGRMVNEEEPTMSAWYDIEAMPEAINVTIDETPAGAMRYDQFEVRYSWALRQGAAARGRIPLVWAEAGVVITPKEWRLGLAATPDLPEEDKSLQHFTSIDDVVRNVFRAPKARPGDVYRLQFWVNKGILREGASSGGTRFTPADVITAAVVNYEKAAGAIDAAGEFLENPGAAVEAWVGKAEDRINKSVDAAEDYVRSNLRYADQNKKKVARNVWKKWREDTRRRQADQRYASAEARAAQILEARKKSGFPTPSHVTYEARTFKKHIEAVASKMDEFQKELVEWQKASVKNVKTSGGSFVPVLDLSVEAQNLRDCIPAFERILGRNGFKLRDKFGEHIKVSYVPDKDETSAKNVLGALIATMSFVPRKGEGFFGTRSASAFVGGDYQTDEESEKMTIRVKAGAREFDSHIEAKRLEGRPDIDSVNRRNSLYSKLKHPFNNPRTLAYLMQLEEMYNYINKPADWGSDCNDVLMPKSIPFAMQFTYPLPGIKPRTPDNYGKPKEGPDSFDKAALQVDGSMLKMMGEIKTASQAVSEKIAISEEEKDALLKVEQGKVYDINDLLPLGELCTWEEIQQKVLKKFDFKMMLCEWAQCLAIPWPIEFDWDLNFDFDWPKIPTFDLYMLYPIIVANLLEMLIRLLCTIIMKLLDMIRLPNCDDLFDAALYGISSIANAVEEYHNQKDGEGGIVLFNATSGVNPINAEFLKLIKAQTPGQAEAQKRFIQNLADFGVSAEYMEDNNLDGETVSALFEDVSRILTPTELCALLQGALNHETVELVRSLIISTQPSLASFFRNDTAVSQFFSSLGGLLGQEICDIVSRAPAEAMSSGRCDDGTNLRDYLAAGGADAQQIANALAIAKAEADRRLAVANSLASSNPLDGVVPKNVVDFSDPNAVISDIPPALMNQLSNGVSSIIGTVKGTYLQEITRYVPSLYDTDSRAMNFLDPEFNIFFRIQAEIAMKILMDFESQTPKLLSDMPLPKWEARNSLYTTYRYNFEGFQRQLIPMPFSSPPYRIEYKETVIEVPNAFETSGLPGSSYRSLEDWLQQSNLMSDEGSPMGQFVLRTMLDEEEGVILEEDTSVQEHPELGPKLISATMLSKTEPQDGSILFGDDDWQYTTKYGKVKSASDIANIQLAADGRYGEAGEPTAVADFIKEVMDDVKSRLNELQMHIMRDLEVNHKQRVESNIAPDVRRLILKEEEIKREQLPATLERIYGPAAEVSNLEHFYADEEGFRMIIPEVVDNEGTSYDADITYIEYPADSQNRNVVSTVIRDNVVLKNSQQDAATIIRVDECDESIIELIREDYPDNTPSLFEDFTIPPGKNQRPESLFHLTKKNFELDYQRYGLNKPDMLERGSNAFPLFHDYVYTGLYKHMQEVIFEKVFDQLASSPMFDPEELRKIDNRLRGKAEISPEGCLRLSEGLMNFDRLIKNATDMVREEFKKPENALANRDYSDPGPFEQGVLTALVSLMVDVLLVEIAMRGGVAFSTYSTEKLLNDTVFREYILKFIDSSVLDISRMGFDYGSAYDVFYKKLGSLSGMPVGTDSQRRAALLEFLALKLWNADNTSSVRETSLTDEGVAIAQRIDKAFGTKTETFSLDDSFKIVPVSRWIPKTEQLFQKYRNFSHTMPFASLTITRYDNTPPNLIGRREQEFILSPIKLPHLDDVKKKGRFYIENYIRIIGPGASSLEGDEFKFGQEFQEFRRTLREQIFIASLGSPHLASFGQADFQLDRFEAQMERTNTAVGEIEDRLEELEVMEPVRIADDDNYLTVDPPTAPVGQSQELVNSTELVDFIRASYHEGFDKEMCDIVGAIYSDNPLDPCYMSPKSNYRFPTRLIKKRRKFLKIRPNNSSTYNFGPTDVGIEEGSHKSLFRQAHQYKEDNSRWGVQDSNNNSPWEYYSVPANVCEISKNYRNIDNPEEDTFVNILNQFAPVEGEDPRAPSDRADIIVSLEVKDMVDKIYALEPLEMPEFPDREHYNGGEAIVSSMMNQFTPIGRVRLVTGGKVGYRYPYRPSEVDDKETYPRLKSGLTIKKVQLLDDEAIPYEVDGETEWHPLDPDAPWIRAGRDDVLDRERFGGRSFHNLGKLTEERFEYHKERGHLIENSPETPGLGRPKGIYEEWTEYVIDHEMYVFDHPGESWHHPDEMPALTSLVMSKIAQYTAVDENGRPHANGHSVFAPSMYSGQFEGLKKPREQWPRQNTASRYTAHEHAAVMRACDHEYPGTHYPRVYSSTHTAPRNTQTLGRHQNGSVRLPVFLALDQYPFGGNHAITEHNSFRRLPKNSRPDLFNPGAWYPGAHMSGPRVNNSSLIANRSKSMSFGYVLSRPMGHSKAGQAPDGPENSAELRANQYAVPVRMLVTKIDYKQDMYDEQGNVTSSQVLHSESFINYELPEAVKGLGHNEGEIVEHDFSTTVNVARGQTVKPALAKMNFDRKTSLQRGLNQLALEYCLGGNRSNPLRDSNRAVMFAYYGWPTSGVVNPENEVFQRFQKRVHAWIMEPGNEQAPPDSLRWENIRNDAPPAQRSPNPANSYYNEAKRAMEGIRDARGSREEKTQRRVEFISRHLLNNPSHPDYDVAINRAFDRAQWAPGQVFAEWDDDLLDVLNRHWETHERRFEEGTTANIEFLEAIWRGRFQPGSYGPGRDSSYRGGHLPFTDATITPGKFINRQLVPGRGQDAEEFEAIMQTPVVTAEIRNLWWNPDDFTGMFADEIHAELLSISADTHGIRPFSQYYTTEAARTTRVGLQPEDVTHGPALSVSKVYSAGAHQEAKHKWWGKGSPYDGEYVYDPDDRDDPYKAKLDNLFYKKRRGVLLKQSTLGTPWFRALSDPNANSQELKGEVARFLESYVNCRRYEGFWGRTSSPWWLWGAQGYYPGYRGADWTVQTTSQDFAGREVTQNINRSEERGKYENSYRMYLQYDASDIIAYVVEKLLTTARADDSNWFDGHREHYGGNPSNHHGYGPYEWYRTRNNVYSNRYGVDGENEARQDSMMAIQNLYMNDIAVFRQLGDWNCQAVKHFVNASPEGGRINVDGEDVGTSERVQEYLASDTFTAWLNDIIPKPRKQPGYRKGAKNAGTMSISWDYQYKRCFDSDPTIRTWPDLWDMVHLVGYGAGWAMLEVGGNDGAVPDNSRHHNNIIKPNQCFSYVQGDANHPQVLPAENRHESFMSPFNIVVPEMTSTERISYGQEDSPRREPSAGGVGEIVFGDYQFIDSPDMATADMWNFESRKMLDGTGDKEAKITAAADNNTLADGFNIYAANAAINLLLRAEQEERYFWSQLSQFGTGEYNPEGEPIGIFESLNRRLSAEMSRRLEVLFGETEYLVGSRLVYIVPEDTNPNFGDSGEFWTQHGENPQDEYRDFTEITREERSWMVTVEDESTGQWFRSRCIPLAFNEVPIDMKCHYTRFQNEIASMSAEVLSGLKQKPEYRMLSKYAFPVERYASISSIYSLMALSQREQVRDTLSNTKASIAKLMKLMSQRPPFGNTIEIMDGGVFRSVFMGSMSPDGPVGLPSFMMAKFGDFISDLAYNAMMTPPWLIRSLASGLDPAFKDMRKLAMNPQCKIDGVNWKNVTKTALDNKMVKGVDTKNRTYAPVSTAFPADLFYRGTQISPPFVNKNFFKALVKFANFVAKDNLPPPPKIKAGARKADTAEYDKLVARVNDRYGTFLGPLGLIALGIPPMPGEADMYGEDAGCPPPGSEEEEYTRPEPCPDIEE